ncbi:MAG: clostripain-related cysteine peptidase [Candidatus Wallbacteria bacterium]|nr:clostripain-related cysteine peptidase [Candidatus Wallbacteria bacterium]
MRIIAKFILIISIVFFSCTSSTAGEKWTFMVYLDADNNLQPFGMKDLNEMEKVGSSEDVNMVVLLDRNNKDSDDFMTDSGETNDTSEALWDNTRLYYVKKGIDDKKIESELIEDMPEQNMGDPKTLVSFVTKCVDKYPADKYCLVLWNHGDGWRDRPAEIEKGICYDDSSAGDGLTMEELKGALADCVKKMGKKLAVLEFDACLMAMAEVSSQIRDYCEFAAFSEKTEPGDGDPYDTILAELKGSTDAKAFAVIIVDKYLASYDKNVTKSAVDLSKLDTLEKAIDDFAVTLKDKMKVNAAVINESRNKVKAFEIDSYVDLMDLMKLFKEKISDEVVAAKITAVEKAQTEAVVKNGKMERANGLSIWFPTTKSEFQAKPGYLALEFTQKTAWAEFLGTYYENSPN